MDNKEQKQTKPQKPICMKLAEFENALVSLVNGAGVPFYLLESPLHNAVRQAIELANAERANAEQRYKKELEEYEKNEKSEGETK